LEGFVVFAGQILSKNLQATIKCSQGNTQKPDVTETINQKLKR